MLKLNDIIFGAVQYCTLWGGGGSGGGSSTTTQNIPVELKPLATKYASTAINLADQAYNPYTQNRYADLNSTQNQALGMIQDRALSGDQTMNAAQSNLTGLMEGGVNPYLKNNVNQVLDQVQGRVNSMFHGSNYGTTANQELIAREMGNTASQMYGQAYDADQNRRLSAISQAPTFGNQAYTDASHLMNAGQVQQDQAQQGLDFNYQQFMDQQNLPYKNLAAMSGVFGSNLGGSSSTTQSSGGGK